MLWKVILRVLKREINSRMTKKKVVFGVLIIFGTYFCAVLLFIEPHLHYRKLLIEAESNFRERFINSFYQSYNTRYSDDNNINVCPNLTLQNKLHIKDEDEVKCQQHIPSQSGCKYANEYFVYDKSLRRCDVSDKIEICTIFKNEVKCSFSSCGSADAVVYMHIFDSADGQVKHIQDSASKSDEDILYNLMKYSKISSDDGYEFIFVSCDLDIKKTQLILIDEIVNAITKDGENEPKSDREMKIKMNVLLLDSLSRAHFYRSLRETISSFNEINSKNDAEVLDFELFQALHGHTTENLHAFFSGSPLPENITDEERENSPIGIGQLYKFLKERNYETIYQDDMCYDAVWGMRLDLGNPNNWDDMKKAISDASIDNTGLTMASCKILECFGLSHVFNTGEDEKLCFNGKPQDSYYLQKLIYEFKWRSNLFAFSGLMFSHDAYGLRTQTLDEDLSYFVRKMAKMKDTVTILMADHGNAYTDYVYLDSEGRFEMFHPSLFIILPKSVKDKLDKESLNNLRMNQNRLVTQLDLHHTVKYLADSSYSKRGLFQKVPSTRTCDDLPLRQPNLCLCKGSSTPIQNTTEFIGHLEFAVGKLNNIITKSSPRACKLLVPIGFENVIQRQDGNSVMTMFNILTEPGFHSNNDIDRFSVEVSSITSGAINTLQMKLSSYDRLSKFGGYRNCSDADNTFRLCICDHVKRIEKKITNHPRILKRKTSQIYNLFKDTVSTEEKFVKVDGSKLSLVIRSYKERKYDDDNKEIEAELLAVSFEAINLGKKKENRSYRIRITFSEVENMKETIENGCHAVVAPKSIVYLCTLVRKYSIWKGSYEYSVDFQEV